MQVHSQLWKPTNNPVLRDNSYISAQSDSAPIEVVEGIGEHLVLGCSQAMKPLRERIAAAASSRVPILILGEKGCGKEIFARLIHRMSLDAARPFLKVDCAAFSASNFEDYLLKANHASGNGADSDQGTGYHVGTLFLDEISDLDADSQSKLLKLLQDGTFWRNNTHDGLSSGLRLICASARNPELEVANGKFQPDLYYRISVISLQLPPLRKRHEDIPMLTQQFIQDFNLKFGCEAEALSEPLMTALCSYEWPGNIRQLQNLMKRYVILGSHEVLNAELDRKSNANQHCTHIPEVTQGESISLKRITKDMVRSFERQIITKVLAAHHGNRAEAARALNISYRSLLYKVKSAQIANLAAQNGADQS